MSRCQPCLFGLMPHHELVLARFSLQHLVPPDVAPPQGNLVRDETCGPGICVRFNTFMTRF